MVYSLGSHPCLACGACCAYFRVAFYWREDVPDSLAEDLDSFRKVMKGTNMKHSRRCVSLEGRVGESVVCSSYARRPTPCRDFQASYENGEKNLRCDQARAAHGLLPLRRSDWELPIPPAA